MLDVRRMRVLREVAARGTIAAAADALSFTPSALSQQLSTLEREAGAPLLERDGRGVRLTPAGLALVDHAERILAELEAAESALARQRDEVGGPLRLGAFPTAAARVAAPAMRALRDRYPKVEATLLEAEPEQSLPALKLRELDLVIAHEYDLSPRAEDPGVERLALFAEPLLVALPHRHPAVRDRVRLRTLRGEPWLAGREDTACGRIVPDACRAEGFEPRIAARTNDFRVMLTLVGEGLGVALVPELGVVDVPRGVAIRPLTGRRLERRVFAAVRRGGADRPAVAAMLRILDEVI